jgi:hydrogenase nickel incorporation protein HypA/HybF
MHELSIAMSIVEMAQEEAQRRGVHVSAIYLKVGPLAGVIQEALVSAFDLAAEGTGVEGARLVVEEVPIVVHCPTCREDRKIESPQWLCCPVCNTATPEVIQGSELQVTALEIDE